ncbi:VOC family protein [Erythrobacter arachoides]|uniref:VOC family protein n=1 Tax=Aurantiacibacter arachoides TaxID=1850444 RepID=A0A845A1D1_9SPHN|nr:VOC family protein [Aurantiacibacter arachoides]MXO94343.1 VOC family protein [Aurantiacibacter arachoides]GGD64226.1 hypothetical protein GCM10011411_25650 [Aurantiacibacter arachoides]
MFSHTFLGTNDVEKSRSFYKATLGELGHEGHDLPHGTAFRTEESAFIVAKPADGQAANAANGGTHGFKAKTPDEVDAWHAAGLANGGTDEGAPGVRPGSPGQMYGAYLRDPDGHKICAFAPNRGRD